MCCGYICKNICKSFETKSHSPAMYDKGYVFCSVCRCRQSQPDIGARYCPCCGAHLRYKPTNKPSENKICSCLPPPPPIVNTETMPR